MFREGIRGYMIDGLPRQKLRAVHGKILLGRNLIVTIGLKLRLVLMQFNTLKVSSVRGVPVPRPVMNRSYSPIFTFPTKSLAVNGMLYNSEKRDLGVNTYRILPAICSL